MPEFKLPRSQALRIDGSHGRAAPSHDAAPAADQDCWPVIEPVDERGELIVARPEPALILSAAGEYPASQEERLHLQAAQIAGHLRKRLHEVDRRESQLNARVAQLESDLRASRLWVREREYEFQERESDLRRQVSELQAQVAEELALREAQPAVETASLPEQPNEHLLAREAELAAAEQQLRDRRNAIEREAAAIRHSQQLWNQQKQDEARALQSECQRKLGDFESQYQQRQRDLDTAELMVTDHARQLERDRAALDQERQAWQAQFAGQQANLLQRVQTAEGEIAERQRQLSDREAGLDQQRAALDQLRTELLGVHRQSLELRLIAEQLWSQLNGRLAPAELTRSIAQLKLQLTEQYRLEERTLADQKREIATLGERLGAQHEQLQIQREELRTWATARQAEIEAQAQQLVARELELDRQQEESRQLAASWQADRRRYEQQIRQLAGQLRQVPAAA